MVSHDPPASTRHMSQSFEFTLIGNPGTIEVRNKKGSGVCPATEEPRGVTGDAFGGPCSVANKIF
jgi:hypothetical protein